MSARKAPWSAFRPMFSLIRTLGCGASGPGSVRTQLTRDRDPHSRSPLLAGFSVHGAHAPVSGQPTLDGRGGLEGSELPTVSADTAPQACHRAMSTTEGRRRLEPKWPSRITMSMIIQMLNA